MDQPLCDTTLTASKLEYLLRQSPEFYLNGHQLRNVQANQIAEGQGFASKILRITLDWQSTNPSSQSPPKSVIVKIIGSTAADELFQALGEENVQKLQEAILQAHNIECQFYEITGLRDVITLPICFNKQPNTQDGPGYIILEDFSCRGAQLPFKMVGCGANSAQMSSCLDVITSVHAWSINNTDWHSKLPPLSSLKFILTFHDQMMSMFQKSKEQYPHAFVDFDERKLKRVMSQDRFLDIFGADPKAKYNLPTVLVHGDFGFGNMLFERCPDNEIGDNVVALIDWQCAHQGCGMEDLARWASLSMSTEKRRNQMDGILERYVQLFNSKVNNRGSKITLEDTKRAFDQIFAYTAFMWACSLPTAEPFTKILKITEDERKELKQCMTDYYISNFVDARRYFNI